MRSLPSLCLIVAAALVQMPMASCNGCGDPSNRMNGTIPAPADASTFTILVGRTTFRVPRNARFTDLGGGNYAGYLMHYQTFEGKSLRQYIQDGLPGRNNPENNQHGEAEFDDAKHRVILTYDTSEENRHLEMYQDLGDGGALVLEADYRFGGKSSAVSALTALINDVIPVKPGEPIPQGMGMGNSVLARSTLNDEVANAFILIPLPGYDKDERSGLRIELVSEMQGGMSDDLEAHCHNGQLMQYDLGKSFNNGQPLPYTTDLLRYRERTVAGIAGGETVDLETATDGSFRQATFTYMTDPVHPPAGQASLTLRGDAIGIGKGNDLRETLAVWDSILASASLIPMPAPARGLFSGPPDYKQLPPCQSRPDVNLPAAPKPPADPDAHTQPKPH